jgi:hypothetical protein
VYKRQRFNLPIRQLIYLPLSPRKPMRCQITEIG